MPRCEMQLAAAAVAAAAYRPPPAFAPPAAAAAWLHFRQYARYAPEPPPPPPPLAVGPPPAAARPLDLSLKGNPITPPRTPSPAKKADAPPPARKGKGFIAHAQAQAQPPTPKKGKATRRLTFDEDNTSPVSGTIIRELRPDEQLVVRKGDIDPAFNVVEVTEEAKAELAKIENHIGDYVCRLCKELYEDAFGLAQHRCSRIVHVEYRCPECDKVFNCPANLASHRRWHKPRPAKDAPSAAPVAAAATDGDDGDQFPCAECGKRFRRAAYLRKHQAAHQAD